ncbi:cytochrome P450 71A1-like isoform X1 [Iris pallida]|uniref:Cytochrome P450 71A1-like isoform X1 n=1 Tax=Iris pallida TaxID=29817 RepID=A0AAX6HFI3_IRIPA|nr:cytochrome P450 71A1-like isoform X1 [Iris pallida]
MAAIVLLLLSLLPVLFLFLFLKEKTKQKPRLNLPPGPKPIPIIGNLHQTSHDLPHKTAYEFSKTYGPIVHIRLGQIPSIVVSTPALAKEILRNQDLVFCSRPPLTVLRKYSFNGCDVAAAPYGDLAKPPQDLHPRATQQPEAPFLPLVASIRGRPDDRLHPNPTRPDSPVNISDLMVRLSSSIVCRVVFGYKSKGKYGERSGFHDLLEEGNALFHTVFLADFFPRFGWIIDWFTGARLRLERNARQLDKFYNQVIEEHKISAAAAEKDKICMTRILLMLC